MTQQKERGERMERRMMLETKMKRRRAQVRKTRADVRDDSSHGELVGPECRSKMEEGRPSVSAAHEEGRAGRTSRARVDLVSPR